MKGFKYLILSGLVLIQASALAQTDLIPTRWDFAFQRPGGPYAGYTWYNGQVVQVDNGPRWTVWAKYVWSKPKLIKGKEYTVQLQELLIDCAHRTVAVIRDVKYDSEGKPINDIAIPPLQRHFLHYPGKGDDTFKWPPPVSIATLEDTSFCRGSDEE